MKNLFYLSIIALILTACGTSKKAVTATNNTNEVISTEKEITQQVEENVEERTNVVIETIEKEEIQEVTEPDVVVEQTINTIPVEVFDHTSFNDLLTANVTAAGNVDYEGFRKNRTALRNYITALGSNMPTPSWTQNDRLAYWMNAYNAMTIDLILRNLPLKSIKDIDKPWNQRLWKLGEKWYNLDEIEHKILRKMNDARIHFGINCASFSCPPLLNEAFTSAKVDDQLDFLAKQFVNDTQRNSISATNIKVSKIFTWFAKDFKQDGSLIDFLNKYSNTTIHTNAKKSYKDYDWSLNQ